MANDLPSDIIWPDEPASGGKPASAAQSLPSDIIWPGDDATLSDYGVEAVKGVAQGAKDTVGVALKGAGVVISAGEQEARKRALTQFDEIDAGKRIRLADDIYSYSQMNPEQRKQQRAALEQTIATEPALTENPLYKAGATVSDFGNDFLKAGPGFEGSWTRDIGAGFGSVGTGIAMSMLSPAAAGLMFVSAGSGEAAENAIKAGATKEQIASAARLGTIPGATDVVDALLPSFGTTGKLMAFGKRVGWGVIKGVLAEGGQEGFQQFLQNAIAKGVYKPDQDLFDDVPRSMVIGAIVGGTVSGGVAAADRQRAAIPPNGGQSAGTPPPGAPGAPPGSVPADTLYPDADQPGPAPSAPSAAVQSPPISPNSGGLQPVQDVPAPGTSPIEQALRAAQDPAAPPPVHGTLQRVIDKVAGAEPEAPVSPTEQALQGAAPTEPAPEGMPPTAPVSDTPIHTAPEALPASEAGGKIDTPAPLTDVNTPVGGTREAPVEIATPEDVDRAAAQASTDYTPKQGEGNNRVLGHAKWNGLEASIEVAAGGTRKGTNPKTGETWETSHTTPYGYWKGTEGADGMHVDVNFGPQVENAALPVYVIDEMDTKTGAFRQHKTFAGFATPKGAVDAYLGTSSKTRDMIGGVTPIPAADFPAWVNDKSKTTKRLSSAPVPVAEPVPVAQPAQRNKTPAKPARPQSLIDFIASNGGINPTDPLVGDVRHMLGKKNKPIPGSGALIRKGGKTLEEHREAAAEAGYFPAHGTPDEAMANTKPSHLVDAMREETAGVKQFSVHDQEAAAAVAAVETDNTHDEQDRQRAEAHAYVIETAKAQGVTLTPAEFDAVARLVLAENMDASDALEEILVRGSSQIEADPLSSEQESSDGYGAREENQDGGTLAQAGEPAGRFADEPGEAPQERDEFAEPGQEAADAPAAETEQPVEAGRAGDAPAVAAGVTEAAGPTEDQAAGTDRPTEGVASTEDVPASDLEIPEFLRRTPDNKPPGATAKPAAEPQAAAAEAEAEKPDTTPESDAERAAIRREADLRWRNWVPGKNAKGETILTRPQLRTFAKEVRDERRKAAKEAAKAAKAKPEKRKATVAPSEAPFGTEMFSAAPENEPIQITGKEISADAATMPIGELVRATRVYGRANLAGRLVTNVVDGTEISIPWSGLKKALSGPVHRLKALAVARLDDLIASALPLRVEPDRLARDAIRAVHWYEAAATINGQPVKVQIVVREGLDGRRYYDHVAVAEESPAPGDRQSLAGSLQDDSGAPSPEGDEPQFSLARQHPQAPHRILEGLDLKVGGEGMAGFYDQILPATVNKLVKKYGARVGQGAITPKDKVKIRPATDTGGGWEVYRTNDEFVLHRTVGREGAESFARDYSDTKVHTLAITDDLRAAAVGQGFPPFAPRGWDTADAAEPRSMSPADVAKVQEVVRRVAGIDPKLVDSITIPANSPGAIAWGRTEEGKAGGAYSPMADAIRIALDTGNPRTGYHEAFHRLQRRLLNKAELAVVGAETEKLRDVLRNDMARKNQADSMSKEEVEADAFAVYATNRDQGKATPGLNNNIARGWGRIYNILKRLRNALHGLGYQTVDDVFSNAYEGAYAHRLANPIGSDGKPLFSHEVEIGADGKPQLVIPGAEKEGQKTQAQRLADAPLKPKKVQKPAGGLFSDEKDQGSLFSLAIDPQTQQQRQQVAQGFIARGQPIDRAMRVVFDWFGGLTRDGQWKPGIKITDKASHIIRVAKPPGRFSFLNVPMEAARAGLRDRYGLDKAYVERDRDRSLDKRAVEMQLVGIMNSLKAQGVGATEAKVLQAVLTGDPVNDADMQRLAAPIRDAIDHLGQEAVALGMVSAESYERNRGAYLHRVYLKHESEGGQLVKTVNSIMGNKRKKIIGDQYKGRGIFKELHVDRLMRDVPEWHAGGRGKPQNGDKFIRLDEMPSQEQLDLPGGNMAAVKPLRTVYWPADRAIPDQYADFTNIGTYEVRAVKGNNITIWRDLTKAERTKMGEILDSRYTIAKTFMLAAHDLATGRFYKDIAGNEDWAKKMRPEGRTVDADEWQAQKQRIWKHGGIEWVRVPDTNIADSGGKKKWGALAGMYVREEIWRDLNEKAIMARPGFWRAIQTQWKLNKTARNIGTHVNNVVSNFMLMDLLDVRMQDLASGIRSYVKGDQHYEEALANGAFGSDMMSQEIRDQVLKPILKEIEAAAAGPSPLGALGQASKFTDILWTQFKKVDQFARDAYRVEDELFRMATYMRRRELGDTPKEAAKHAREQFIDYDISAPWVNMARNTVLPFAAYPYRLMTILPRAVLTRPWKPLKYFALGYAANALAYGLTGDDDEDKEARAAREDRERRSLPEREQGRTWFGAQKMVRLGNDQYGNPVFKDIKRWVPGGDLYDMPDADWLPQWLTPGGPIVTFFELLLNKSAFTGKDIVDPKTDDWWERQKGKGDFAWKAIMPGGAYVPGSHYNEKLEIARAGGTDRDGRPNSVPQAAAQSVGIKIKPHDVEEGMAFKSMDFEASRRALEAKLNRLGRQFERKMITEDAYNKAVATIEKKIEYNANKLEEATK